MKKQIPQDYYNSESCPSPDEIIPYDQLGEWDEVDDIPEILIDCRPQYGISIIDSDFILDSTISSEAKVIISIFASKRKYKKGLREFLYKHINKGHNCIQRAINELVDKKYLRYYYCRDGKTKQILRKFWAYTDVPERFNLKEYEEMGEITEREIILEERDQQKYRKTHSKKKQVVTHPMPEMEHRGTGSELKQQVRPDARNGASSRARARLSLNINTNTKDKTITLTEGKWNVIVARELDKIISTYDRKKPSNDKIISQWSIKLSKFVEENEVSPMRLRHATAWLSDHVGEQYIPSIHNIDQFISKFFNLEEAMNKPNPALREVAPSKPVPASISAEATCIWEMFNLDAAEVELHLPALRAWYVKFESVIKARAKKEEGLGYKDNGMYSPTDNERFYEQFPCTFKALVKDYVGWLTQFEPKYQSVNNFLPASKMFLRWLSERATYHGIKLPVIGGN